MRSVRSRSSKSGADMPARISLSAGVVVVLATTAAAHVVFTGPNVQAGQPFELTLKVQHGCKGSPTIRLRVRIPKGIVDARPTPKPDWRETVSGGGAGSPAEIDWSGLLPDKQDGSFTFTGRVAPDVKPGTIIHFPVVQECEKGVERWIETTPKAGGHHDDSSPAPSIRVAPKR